MGYKMKRYLNYGFIHFSLNEWEIMWQNNGYLQQCKKSTSDGAILPIFRLFGALFFIA